MIILILKAYYLAWGPVPQTNTEFRQSVLVRVVGLTLLAAAIYTAAFKWMRCRILTLLKKTF